MVSGRLIHLDIRKVPFYDQRGQVIGTVAVGRDVTIKKEAERDLRLEKQQYSGIFNQLPFGLVTCNSEGDITECNPRAAELLGKGMSTRCEE